MSFQRLFAFYWSIDSTSTGRFRQFWSHRHR